jgi:hypothetical protein
MLVPGVSFIARASGEDEHTLFQQLHLPIQFTENRGQWAPQVKYAMLRGSDAVWFQQNGLVLNSSLPAGDVTAVDGIATQRNGRMLEMRFAHSSSRMSIETMEKTSTASRFYYGNDAASWVENASAYRALRYSNVWNDIDVEYLGEGDRLIQRFILRCGARPSDIALSMNGDSHLDHSLRVVSRSGASHAQFQPTISYKNGIARFSGLPDVLRDDVILTTEFLTYFGGSGVESASGMDIDSAGNIYILGATSSVDLPLARATQSSYGGGFSDLFVMRFNPDGHSLSFCTFLGGTKQDTCALWGRSWTIGPAFAFSSFKKLKLGHLDGRLYCCASTKSPDFPVTSTAVQTKIHVGIPGAGCAGLLLSMSLDGALLHSTYLSGPGDVLITSLAVDLEDNVYAGGMFGGDSLWFITKNTVQPVLANRPLRRYDIGLASGGFAVKLSRDLDQRIWGTYVFAPDGENFSAPDHKYDATQLYPLRLDIDSKNNVIITGHNTEPALYDSTVTRLVPLVNAIQDCRGSSNLFATKLNDDASAYVFSTYLGGTKFDYLSDEVVDRDDNIILTGTTQSIDFPLAHPIGNVNTGETSFLAKISPQGTLLVSTYIGSTSGTRSTTLDIDVCGNVVIGGNAYSPAFPFVNATDTTLGMNSYVPFQMVLDPSCTRIRQSSFLKYPDGSIPRMDMVRIDAAGYLYYVAAVGPFSQLRPPSFGTFNAYQKSSRSQSEIMVGKLRYPTCEQIACSIACSDTLRQAARRRYVSPSRFTVSVTVQNVTGNLPVRDVRVQLDLPDSMYLDPLSQNTIVTLSPATFTPGMQASHSWTLRVDSTRTAPADREVSVTTTYTPASGPIIPPPSEHCSMRIPLLIYNEPEPKLECALNGDTAFHLSADGTRFDNSPHAISWTLRNKDTRNVTVSRVVLDIPANRGIHSNPLEGTPRLGTTLSPGNTLAVSWDLLASVRTYDRSIPITVTAFDEWNASITECQMTVFAPGSDALPCTLSGPSNIIFDTASGASTPDTLRYMATLFNPTDTIQSVLSVEALPGSAGHLIPLPPTTESGTKIPSRLKATMQWYYRVRPPIATTVWDTMAIRYQTTAHPAWRWCNMPVRIVPILSLQCRIEAPDHLSEAPVGRDYSPSMFTLRGIVTNPGLMPVTLAAYELRIDPEGSCEVAEPRIHPASMIPGGVVDTAIWTIHARRLHRSVGALQIGFVVKDSSDETHTQCIHHIVLPALPNDLSCTVAAPDSLRYEVATDTYTPNPFTASLSLSNHLDTAQINIETAIDLSSASHLKISAGEVNAKLIAVIDSHATESVLYNLEVALRTDSPITERIAIKYRHPDDKEWKRCEKDILIEGEKRMFTASCSARGHDTIWIVAPYEEIIPVPIQVQHTISNTGNVPLTLCSASILLPAGCTLAQGSDSVQSFGTILPSRSVSREWLVDVDPLTALPGARDIRWKWNCAETREDSSCTHTVRLVPNGSRGIVFTPWLLRFNAKENGTLPASQTVQLWTGTATLPWQLQAQSSWLDLQPLSGNSDELIAVRPNTTALASAVYNDMVRIWSVPATTVAIEVEYLVEGVTAVDAVPPDGSVVLGQNYPNPVKGVITNYKLRITNAGWVAFCVRDVFGRVVISSSQSWLAAGTHRLSIDASRLAPGVYLCTVSAGGERRTRVFVVE